MRLLIARMSHETNTFSPVPTDEDRFRQGAWFFGDEIPPVYEGTRTGMGAYLELAAQAGADIVTPAAISAAPSGHVHDAPYERCVTAICDAVRAGGLDGIMLDLHGAMVTQSTQDGEGTLLRRIREIDPTTPICVNLDLHTNLTELMVANCTAMIGYKTYPHIDSYETAMHIGQVLLDAIAGKTRPTMAWGNRPLLAQTLRMGHEDTPMGPLLQRCREMEERGEALAATLFGGFPLADFPDAGLSAVVVTDANQDPDNSKARALCEELLDAAWEQRAEFIYQHTPLHDAVGRAKQITDGPVILLDHADNTASGGTQDVMTVIAEVLSQDLEDVAIASVKDPGAVQQMIAAGVGAEVEVDLGGKTDMPTIGRRGESLRVKGTVRVITDGDYKVTGPMGTGTTVHMGPTAVLDTGKAQIVVCSYNNEPFDQGVFTSVGIDPASKRYLLLKSRIHYRAGFKPIARHTLTLDGTGVTSSDNALFKFQHVRRPIYPLDEME